MKLIFAQGNPEPQYSGIRHNAGFMVLNSIADEHEAKWSEKPKFHAVIAEIDIDGEKILLVKPNTFYNETGPSLRKLVDYYKIDTENDLLVIHDDLALPFGTIRIRKQGNDAGNNGIKSINAHIDGNYTRIKIGIYNDLRDKMDDADFVLAKFSSEESSQLEKTIIPHASKLVIQFCDNSLEHTSYKNLE
ncbi:MAG TPA: aminoacyl-tRNA hydrolase [Candidatus Saccharimonadales bacterium]|nr:aminoacyl-tRNA hydrolase [Candidatus Saccharimonadales bacterium]